MEGTVERLVRYAQVHTDSEPGHHTRPSTPWQIDLTKMLHDEMTAIGISNVRMDDMGYVYGEIPATKGCEDAPAIGFIAHIDTAPDFTGLNVHPRVIENYDGEAIELGAGRVLDPKQFPHLKNLKGDTLVVTDGTTLLGGDDKAGVAVIMTACEKLLNSDMPHGKVCVAFNPDEEIGEGPWDFDVDALGADFAYTIDFTRAGDIIYECFNASAVEINIRGFNIHPGKAKGTMINAGLVATELASMFPLNETPRETEGYEGFFHLSSITGNTEKAILRWIIRDHDYEKFQAREQLMRDAVAAMNAKYGEGTVTCEIKQQYRNMAEEIKKHFHLIENAIDAAREAGVEPHVVPMRGGTDGAQLTMKKGLPCPNLGEGDYCGHGPYEHVSKREMDQTVNIVLGIIRRYAKPGAAPEWKKEDRRSNR